MVYIIVIHYDSLCIIVYSLLWNCGTEGDEELLKKRAQMVQRSELHQSQTWKSTLNLYNCITANAFTYGGLFVYVIKVFSHEHNIYIYIYNIYNIIYIHTCRYHLHTHTHTHTRTFLLSLVQARYQRRWNATWACFCKAGEGRWSFWSREMRNFNLSTTLLDRRRIVFNQRFEWIAAAVLLGNSMLVGIEAEFTLNNLNSVPHLKFILLMLLKPKVLDSCWYDLMSMSVWEGDESLRRRTLPDALLTKVNQCSPFSLQWTDGKRQSVDNMFFQQNICGPNAHLFEEPYWLIRLFDIIFSVCFTIELFLRLAAWSPNCWFKGMAPGDSGMYLIH